MEPQGGVNLEVGINKQESLTFVKQAPTFKEALATPEGRINKITSTLRDKSTNWEKVEREFTEAEGLQNLNDFVSRTIQVALNTGDDKIKSEAEAFRDKLEYVGERELVEATQGLAKHIKDTIQSGKNVYVYISGVRSERYISLRIMEEFDALIEDTPELRQKVHISDDLSTIEDRVDNDYQSMVMVPDDFVLSGTRIYAATGRLTRLGKDRIEALLVAAPKKSDRNSKPYKNSQVYSYYAMQEGNMWGAGITGSHCSTDYGFEDQIKEFGQFLEENGQPTEPPLLDHIMRPYINQSTSWYFVGYDDPELQRRWENISQKYSLPQSPSS